MSAYLRHRWDHKLAAHRAAVRAYNGVMRHVPFKVKYGLGQYRRRNKIPYSIIDECSTVIQVGAPADTLHAGRSRAMHFALLVPRGRVVVVEPDRESAEQFKRLCIGRGLSNVSIHNVGAWSTRTKLRLYVDSRHPATNFTEGSTNYDDKRLRDFRASEVEVDTLDNILSAENINSVDLLSITTNGAEKEILTGLGPKRIHMIKHIALACTGVVDDVFMKSLGFEKIAFDDRGFTYRQISGLTPEGGQARENSRA